MDVKSIIRRRSLAVWILTDCAIILLLPIVYVASEPLARFVLVVVYNNDLPDEVRNRFDAVYAKAYQNEATWARTLRKVEYEWLYGDINYDFIIPGP